jgi:hypothetical protein
MSATTLIDEGIKTFGSAKLADSNVVIDLLLDIRQAIKEDTDGQEDHQEEAEGSRVLGPVPAGTLPEVS